MKKRVALVFFSSALLFLVTCWSAGLNVYAAGFTESVCFFVFTYYALQKFAESDIVNRNTTVVTAIIRRPFLYPVYTRSYFSAP